jgi:2-keto-myo-inositol isomerase
MAVPLRPARETPTMNRSEFALNHMAAPRLGLEPFLDLARALGMHRVEIRNDLEGKPIADGTPPSAVLEAVEARGLEILSINALQRFNDWSPARDRQARDLADYAARCGARALVLVPVNDSDFRPDAATRLSGLRTSLKALAHILQEAGVIGLVEPLGFEVCSLRSKREAIEAIDELGLSERFRLVHDTFHHHLSGETEIFPDRTGLVHVSGVEDPTVPLSELRDAHRVLVGPGDSLGNVAQVRALRAGGYTGPLSFEPFAEEVHAHPDIGAAIASSADHLARSVG